MQVQEAGRAGRSGKGEKSSAIRWVLRAMLPIALGGPGSAVCLADELPEAGTILDRYVEVTGGKEAYANLSSRVATGFVDMPHVGIRGIYTQTQVSPARMHTVMEADAFGAIEEGTDGEVAWAHSLMMGPRVKVGAERAYILRQAALDAPAQWRRQFRQVACVGQEIVNGKGCYKVELTPSEGRPETRYYEEASGLLVKTELVLETELGPVPAVIFTDDYRQVDGVLLPHRVKTSLGNEEMIIVFEGVRHNLDAAPDLFEPPVAVQALLDKQQQAQSQAAHAASISSS
jgi:hypothetical protein